MACPSRTRDEYGWTAEGGLIEAYKELFERDHARTAQSVDDLPDTGMYLPITSRKNVLSWAYE